MRLQRVVIENYRAFTRLELHLDPQGNVFFGGNAKGKTSVLSAIAVGLGGIPKLLPQVSGIGFRSTDRRGAAPVRVELEATDGTKWERTLGGSRRAGRLQALKSRLDPLLALGGRPEVAETLPIVAFYDADRAVVDSGRRRGRRLSQSTRFAALDGALSPRPDFRSSFAWFAAKEREEAAARRERRDLGYRLPELEAVRRAVAAAIPGVSDLKGAARALEVSVSVADEGKPGRLLLGQLGDGDRILLALVADLARRMAQGNPHLQDPLHAEAVVLVDEVDLHLHPSREQQILPAFSRAFPNTQFLVTTNSPQVLTTMAADQCIHLEREDGTLGAFGVCISTYGAPAGRTLHLAMGVDERPNNPFVKDLRRYLDLVAKHEGETEGARALRKELAEVAPDDPDLRRAALEIRRQRAFGLLREAK